MRSLIAFLVLLLLLPFAACISETDAPDGDEGTLVIYSGRRDVLVDPLVEMFRAETGLNVEVRYGTDAELLAALEEEGENSQADIFWANSAGALGAASNAGLLVALPDSILQKPEAFVPSSGLWTPVTSRFRVLAYNPQTVDVETLPASVLELPGMSDLQGRIGWTPTYSSFIDFITALRETQGEEAAATWLEGMKSLDPNAYASNTPMLEALEAGEIDVALTNHYYVARVLYGGEEGEHEDEEEEEEHEEGEGHADASLATYHFAAGDVGNLALVTGAGILSNSDQNAAAARFLTFLLSPGAQAFAAGEVHEYPVIRGTVVPTHLLQFDEAMALSPVFDFEGLRNLEGSLDLLREQGLL